MQNLGLTFGSLSLTLALIAWLPSIAAFTPAILLSFLALPAALIGASLGAFRTGFLAILVVVTTTVTSPLSPTANWFSSVRAEYWLLGMAMALALMAVLLLWDYRRRNNR